MITDKSPLDCRRELNTMPGDWTLITRSGRPVYRRYIVPGGKSIEITYRRVAPVGWVVFSVGEPLSGGGGVRIWTPRRKADATSYESPTAAAVAAVIANVFD